MGGGGFAAVAPPALAWGALGGGGAWTEGGAVSGGGLQSRGVGGMCRAVPGLFAFGIGDSIASAEIVELCPRFRRASLRFVGSKTRLAAALWYVSEEVGLGRGSACSGRHGGTLPSSICHQSNFSSGPWLHTVPSQQKYQYALYSSGILSYPGFQRPRTPSRLCHHGWSLIRNSGSGCC